MAIGTLSLNSTGKATTTSGIAAIVAASSRMVFKWVQKTDGLRALGASSTAAFLTIDADGAGTNEKVHLGWNTDGSGNVALHWAIVGVGGGFGTSGAVTGVLPVNGNYIICVMDIQNNNQVLNVYSAIGTMIAGLSGSFAVNTGANPFSGITGGFVTLNKDTGNLTFAQTAQVYGGLEIGVNGALPSLSGIPTGTDASGAGAWLLNDGASGSTPTSAAAIISTIPLALTNNTWLSDTSLWATAQVPTTATCSPTTASISTIQTVQLTGTIFDAGSNPILNEPVTWSTSDGTIATVNATGLVHGMGAGVATITVADTANNAVNATCVVTVSATAPATIQLTAVAYSTPGSGSPNLTVPITWRSSASTIATVSNVGLVAAVAAGTANIIATAAGIDSPACVVTVT